MRVGTNWHEGGMVGFGVCDPTRFNRAGEACESYARKESACGDLCTQTSCMGVAWRAVQHHLAR